MVRAQEVERQPLLFPVGELGPPDGPVGPVVATGAAPDDAARDAVMAALAWLMVRAYCEAQVSTEEPADA